MWKEAVAETGIIFYLMLGVGMDVQEVIDRVEGIHCGFKATSCPDQLAQALKTAIGK